MTERDLSTLVRDHVTTDEPPFMLSADTVIGGGRRRVRVRRAVGAVACAAVVSTVGLVAVPGMLDDTSDGSGPDTAAQEALANYDPQEMARLLKERADGVLDAPYPAHPEGKVVVRDGDWVELPTEHWDKASGMSVSYGDDQADHNISVSLYHSRGEAEGDAKRNCANDLDAGYYLVCDVITTSDGEVVVTRVSAKRFAAGDGWYVVPRDKIDDANPKNLWFDRQVESVHSATFLTTATETVKAADLETAEGLFRVPVSDFTGLVTDADLVMPPPPKGDNGCDWMLNPGSTSCGPAPDTD